MSDIVGSNLIASKVLVTLALLGYFWGVEKSDKCLQLVKLSNFNLVQHAASCRHLPPVSIFDPGVFLRAMFVVMPCLMADSMSASKVKELIFFVSLCMFVAPILPPSRHSPPPGAPFIAFSIIWVVAKLDASIRAGVAIGLTMLIARIPGVSGFVSGAMDSLFPIIGEGGSAQLFRAALEGGALFAFIMLLIRSSQLLVYGWAKATGFLVCFAISWGLLQYFAEGVFKLDAMVVGQVLGSFLIVTLAGFVVDLYAHRHSE